MSGAVSSMAANGCMSTSLLGQAGRQRGQHLYPVSGEFKVASPYPVGFFTCYSPISIMIVIVGLFIWKIIEINLAAKLTVSI